MLSCSWGPGSPRGGWGRRAMPGVAAVRTVVPSQARPLEPHRLRLQPGPSWGQGGLERVRTALLYHSHVLDVGRVQARAICTRVESFPLPVHSRSAPAVSLFNSHLEGSALGCGEAGLGPVPAASHWGCLVLQVPRSACAMAAPPCLGPAPIWTVPSGLQDPASSREDRRDGSLSTEEMDPDSVTRRPGWGQLGETPACGVLHGVSRLLCQ